MTQFALRPEDFYHTGIIVPDLDAAMARLSALAGCFAFEATADTAGPSSKSGLALFAYYVDAAGTRVEIVDRGLFPEA